MRSASAGWFSFPIIQSDNYTAWLAWLVGWMYSHLICEGLLIISFCASLCLFQVVWQVVWMCSVLCLSRRWMNLNRSTSSFSGGLLTQFMFISEVVLFKIWKCLSFSSVNSSRGSSYSGGRNELISWIKLVISGLLSLVVAWTTSVFCRFYHMSRWMRTGMEIFKEKTWKVNYQ